MAEQKGGTDDGEESIGEFVSLRNVDDSGIESGEDLRGVNPEVMKEVEDALGKLECVIHGLDPSRRVAVTQLMSTLQSCLRIPPKRRQTVGVTPEELATARKWFSPPLEEFTLEHVTFNPVSQRAGYFMEPAPQKGTLSYIAKTERGDSGSLQDYDPSLILFTPEQNVQIAVHKAAINKQISQEEKRRESSDDGDVSSGDDNSEIDKYNGVSSAQRLLQLATESAKKNPSAARFHNRSNRKMKMKRANTIDIPKPANFFEYSSGDEYGASADEVNTGFERRRSNKDMSFLPPSFEPKTENDLKFLAFLKQVNDNQPKVQTYNPSARGGKHWSNRFSSIKTAFEQVEQKPQSAAPSPAKMFWQNTEAGRSKSSREQPSKLPWTVKTENDGVVVGSLTVSKPGHVNNFNHAPKSAFKPIEKKPTSTVSGTVKQIAAQKFSVGDNEFINKPIEKVVKKVPTSHSNDSSTPKQNGTHSFSAFKPYTSTNTAMKNKFSEPIHSTSNNHLTNTSKYCKPTESVGSKDVSKFANGSSNTQSKNVSVSKNKVISSNPNPYSSASAFKSYNNNNFDYHSKTQQNTLTAKKHFMEFSETKGPKEDKGPNPYYFDQHSIVNMPQDNTNGLTKEHHKKFNYEYKQPKSQNQYSYPRSSKESNLSEPKYSKSKIIQPIPVSLEKPASDISNYDSYSKRNVGETSAVQKDYIPKNIPDISNHPAVNIVKPIIIPKECFQRTAQNPDNSGIRYINASKNFSEPSIPPDSFKTDYHPPDLHSSASLKFQNDKMPSNFHMPSQISVQPSPPLRRDSLPKSIQNPEVYDRNPDQHPVIRDHHYDNSYSQDSYCDNDMKQFSEDCSSRLTESNYCPSSDHDNRPYTTYIRSSNNTVKSSTPQDLIADSQSTNINQSNYLLPTIVPTPPLVKSELPLSPGNLPTPSSLDRLSPNRQYNYSNKAQSDPRYLSPSYQSVSPSLRYEDDDSPWGSVTNGDDSPLEEKAVSKVMGQAQCQQAITVNSRTKRRFDLDLESELKLQLKQSAQKKSLSPSFPNVIQKSESWHQMVKEQMHQAKQAPPLPKISKAKSSHSLAQPKQFEAALAPDSVTQKKITVSQYLAKQQARSVKSTKSNPKYKSTNTLYVQNDDDDLENVDEIFENIFQETTRKRNSK